MKSKEEITQIIEHAKEMRMKSVTIDGITYELNQEPQMKTQMTDEDLEKLEAMQIEDELTEEEIKFYATPYFDFLQEEKEKKKQLKKEHEDLNG